MFPAKTGCTTLVMPLITEPGNNNSVLVYDLRHDPQPFIDLTVEALNKYLFIRTEDLPEGMSRLPVKAVKINKCPALAPRNTLDTDAAKRIEIDLQLCHQHWQKLCGHLEFFQRIAAAYTRTKFEPSGDVDSALYDGFLDNNDTPLLAQIRRATPQALAKATFDFHDQRLPELLFRYRARQLAGNINRSAISTMGTFSAVSV